MVEAVAKYQRYAEYKDSGVDWLGEIPSHWQITHFKWLNHDGKAFASGPFGSSIGSQFYQEGGVPVIRGNNLVLDAKKPKFINDGYVYLSDNKANELSNAEVLWGDLVFTARGTVGQVGLIPNDGSIKWKRAILSANQLRFRNKNKLLSSEYLWYLFSSWLVRTQITLSSDSVAQPNLNLGSLKALKLLIPSLVEQNKIANFLDHETAKIDSLIAKQEKLIELLKEKRQAVISHAVTKGLNHDVPMKDSGVEWLGDVPEHWELVPLKYLCSFSGGGTPSKDNLSYWNDGDIPWVSPKDMKTFWIKETQDYITEKAIKESSTNMVEPNSLLMVVRSGILQRTIPIAINKVPVTMNQDMKALKFGNRVLVEYIADLIHGNTSELLLEWSKEGATVESIEHEYLANSIVLVPPIEEQQSITTLVAKKMDVYRELTCKAESQILLLQERRTALISAAVTGKIDVRNWQNPTEAKMEFSA